MFALLSMFRDRGGMLLVGGMIVLLGLVANARCDDFSAASSAWAGHRHVWLQMVWLGVAVAVTVGVVWFDYRRLGRYGYLLFLAALGMLVAVYWFPAVNAAHRWIRLGPLGFQPSELAKVACVLALARYLRYRDDHRQVHGLVMPLVLVLLPMALVLKEPDLGTALLFVPIWFVMLMVAGARRGDLACCLLMGLMLAPVLWQHMSREQRSRVTSLLEQAGPQDKPADDAYQLHQAKQMLALGGVWGSLMAGQAVQDEAVYYLPEARSDFILCVLGERLGLWGLALTLGLFGLLIAWGYRVAIQAEDPFGRLAAAGLTTLLAAQVLVNTGMNVGLLPVTGVSLPLVSYGGSGLVSYALALAILTSIARQRPFEAAREPFQYVLRRNPA